MEDTQSVATLLESTTSKIQQLQKAFAELESHRAVTLNLKWKQIEDHFHGLEKSLKRRFTELEDQEREFETKTTQSRQMLEKRQTAVMGKEEASLERLQEKRDAAVAAITNALGKRRNGHVEPATVNSEEQGGASIVEEKPPDAMASECKMDDLKMLSDSSDVKALTNPQLAKLCEENDAQGLHKFISDNRKNLASIKEEIPIALKAAADPGGLVLDSLSGFYISENSNMDGKKDSNLLGQRRTCIMLMECLSILLANLDENFVSKVISIDVKERAKAIAEEWKPKLDDLDVDASNGNSLEAHAFLQLVATFAIDSDFLQEDLSKLIPMVSRRRQTADLCRFLGLSEKMPGVIDVLVNSGRHIDAVNLAFAFELTHKFSPVSLLKSYLTEARRVPSAIKSGNMSPTAQNDVSERELSALKAVIKCIEDHKLEDQYPLVPLQKRILQLEKAKADKKRATEVAKPQPKRPRANGIAGYAPRNTNIAAVDKNFYGRMTDRYAPPTPYVYDNRPYAYPGPADNHIPVYMGTTGYNMAPNHGNYFGSGYQYQAPYLH
ncbi:FRIGIDA-like protein 3 [Cynara cardunculus var. scolymus]|uniref:FRIGIDA-like protein 3 n=1 Tax=Cynara cardunculus var. scolymus TaxID=59895 RepID=UPI000D62A96D|nr:FRIGIDA-like protein 3 [Cynara cardunculus var. scolymus]XP_024966828.1 FRIGIDA-like protein 3 [Cynara cardunculus var. scolymus]